MASFCVQYKLQYRLCILNANLKLQKFHSLTPEILFILTINSSPEIGTDCKNLQNVIVRVYRTFPATYHVFTHSHFPFTHVPHVPFTHAPHVPFTHAPHVPFTHAPHVPFTHAPHVPFTHVPFTHAPNLRLCRQSILSRNVSKLRYSSINLLKFSLGHAHICNSSMLCTSIHNKFLPCVIPSGSTPACYHYKCN